MSETTLIAIILGAMGAAVCALGAAARNGRIDLALAGHTRDTTSADSWQRAHRRIGAWFLAAGLTAIASGCVVLVAESMAAWAAAAGFAALAALPLVGAALGIRELRRAGPIV